MRNTTRQPEKSSADRGTRELKKLDVYLGSGDSKEQLKFLNTRLRINDIEPKSVLFVGIKSRNEVKKEFKTASSEQALIFNGPGVFTLKSRIDNMSTDGDPMNEVSTGYGMFIYDVNLFDELLGGTYRLKKGTDPKKALLAVIKFLTKQELRSKLERRAAQAQSADKSRDSSSFVRSRIPKQTRLSKKFH